MVDIMSFGTETEVNLRVDVFVEGFMRKEGEERGDTCAAGYKDCVCFIVKYELNEF